MYLGFDCRKPRSTSDKHLREQEVFSHISALSDSHIRLLSGPLTTRPAECYDLSAMLAI